tara:strand:- start:28342 stop:28752 length:411 start_codon:yes stop_codon:yes gene_type:complete
VVAVETNTFLPDVPQTDPHNQRTAHARLPFPEDETKQTGQPENADASQAMKNHTRKMLPDITSTPQMKIRHQSQTHDEPSGQESSAGYRSAITIPRKAVPDLTKSGGTVGLPTVKCVELRLYQTEFVFRNFDLPDI